MKRRHSVITLARIGESAPVLRPLGVSSGIAGDRRRQIQQGQRSQPFLAADAGAQLGQTRPRAHTLEHGTVRLLIPPLRRCVQLFLPLTPPAQSVGFFPIDLRRASAPM